ncbi:MAG: hypothetical protein ABI467_18255 [Kofleriaceae bacterium]
MRITSSVMRRSVRLPSARLHSSSTARTIARTAIGPRDPLNPAAIMIVEAALCALVALVQHLPSARAAPIIPSHTMWIVAGAWLALAAGVAVVRLAGASFAARRRHAEQDGDLFTAVLVIAVLFAVSMAAGAL